MSEAGGSALGTVADTVNSKTEDGNQTERTFKTARFGMKLQNFGIGTTNTTGKKEIGNSLL